MTINGLWEEEKLFIGRIEELCEDLPELTNINYSLKDWTYKKLCVPKFSDRHKLWILGCRINTVRKGVKAENSFMIYALVEVIIFCLAWMYTLRDWEKNEWKK